MNKTKVHLVTSKPKTGTFWVYTSKKTAAASSCCSLENAIIERGEFQTLVRVLGALKTIARTVDSALYE